MKIPKNEPSAIIIPFGKHKGETVAELLAKDPASQIREMFEANGFFLIFVQDIEEQIRAISNQ